MVFQHVPHKAQLRAWLLYGLIILNAGIALTFVGMWVIAARQELFWNTDFNAFYTGWAIVRDGRGAQLYDPDVQAAYQLRVLEGRVHEDGLLPYVNPPHMTPPFVPLAWLPRATAFGVWTLGQLALLAWLLYLLRRVAGSWERDERVALLVTVLAFPPLMLTLMISTFSLLLTVCLLQLYLTLKSARTAQSGLWLILGTIKPQAMLLPGVMLLAARRWRTLASALLSGLALAGLATLLLGRQVWGDYLSFLRTYGGLVDTYGVMPTEMYNLRGTLTLLLGSDQSGLIHQISYGALVGVAGLAFWLWRGPWRPTHPSFELKFALTLLLGLLFNPHLNSHDGLMLVVPAVLFYVYLRRRGRPVYRVYAVLALSCPALFLAARFTVSDHLGIRVPTLAMLGLVVGMGRALYDERGGE